MNDLLLRTSRAWEKAASKNDSMIVAAFMSNVHLTVFEDIEHRLKLLCDGLNPAVLHAMLLPLGDSVRASESMEGSSNVMPLQYLADLQLPYEALIRS